MNRLCRKIAQLLLLTTLLAITGVHGYYYVRACFAKWAFAHQTYFADNELIRITIHQKSLTAQTDFLVNKEEFVWGGEMVDVLYREVRSDTLYVYGFLDTAETELNRETGWLFQQVSQSDNMPVSGTRKSGWDTLVCLSCEAIFPAFHSGRVAASSADFAYSTPHPMLPLLDVLCMPPIQ